MFRSLCLLAVLLAAVNAAVVNVIVGPTGSLSFAPQNITIQVLDTVQWTWQTDDHTVDSGLIFGKCATDSHFSSGGVFNAGHVFNNTFDTVGVFPYVCTRHCGAGMYGQVTVVAAPVTLTSGSSTGGSTTNASSSTTSKITFHTATSGSSSGMDTLTSSTTTTDGNQTSATTDATSPSSAVSPAFFLVVAAFLGLTYAF